MSAEQAIRYGIDLGTTNSSIAILRGSQVRVVHSRHDMRITPSVVQFGVKNGALTKVEVGHVARQQLAFAGEARIAQRFKAYMGEPGWHFDIAGTERRESARELSARVLRELVDSLKRDPSLPALDGVVITVPAIFEGAAREDTLRAAEAAGIGYVQLFSEPEAAALAFGHQVGMQGRCTWLVYDLGGGTFDAAIVRGEDGVFAKVDTDGDRDLGGADLDAAIVEQLFLPALPEDLRAEALRRQPNGSRSATWWQLIQAAETAKIELDLAEQHFPAETVQGFDLDQLCLRQADLQRLQASLFAKTLVICRRLLERNGLAPNQIDRVLLVGGPTRSPFLRRMIEHGIAPAEGLPAVTGLGIALEASVDPMTAVASGAALYAATQRMPIVRRTQPAAVAARVAVDNHTATQVLPDDSDVIVTARVRALDAALVIDDRWSVVIERLDGASQGWTSEPLRLRANGAFTRPVRLEPGENAFRVRVLDAAQQPVEAEDEGRFAVLRAPQPGERSLDYGIGISLNDGSTDWFFRKGDPIPSGPRSKPYSTTAALGPDGSAEITIPLLEGAEASAKLNREVFRFPVPAAKVGRPVPSGARMHVTVSVDRNGLYGMAVELPDFGFTDEVDKITPGTELGDIHAKFKLVTDNLRLFRSARKESMPVDQVVTRIEESFEIDEVGHLLDDGTPHDPKPWRKARTLVLEMLKAQEPLLDEVDSVLRWGPERDKCTRNVRIAREIADELADLDAGWRREFDALCRRFDDAVARRDRETANRIAFAEIPAHWKSDKRLAGYVSNNGDVDTEKPRVATTERLPDKQAPIKRP